MLAVLGGEAGADPSEPNQETQHRGWVLRDEPDSESDELEGVVKVDPRALVSH